MKFFDRRNLNEVRAIIDKHLADAADDLGINISLGNIRYSDDQFTVKLTGEIRKTEQDLIYEENEFNQSARLMGLDIKFNHEFTVRGNTYRAKQIKLRNRKYPIIAENIYNGKLHKFSEERFRE